MGTKRRTRIDPASKIDLFKQHKGEYVAPSSPVLITVGDALYLAVTGRGEPGGEEFQRKVGALYGVAYTIKMTRKFAGKGDYVIGKLEGQYWSDAGEAAPFESGGSMNWRLMIRTPEVVGSADLTDAVDKLTAKGKGDGADQVELRSINEGRCVQMLHVGPYDKEDETVQQMLAFARSQGLSFRGPHHEIYLSDPRRVAPEKLRTILRLPVV